MAARAGRVHGDRKAELPRRAPFLLRHVGKDCRRGSSIELSTLRELMASVSMPSGYQSRLARGRSARSMRLVVSDAAPDAVGEAAATAGVGIAPIGVGSAGLRDCYAPSFLRRGDAADSDLRQS